MAGSTKHGTTIDNESDNRTPQPLEPHRTKMTTKYLGTDNDGKVGTYDILMRAAIFLTAFGGRPS